MLSTFGVFEIKAMVLLEERDLSRSSSPLYFLKAKMFLLKRFIQVMTAVLPILSNTLFAMAHIPCGFPCLHIIMGRPGKTNSDQFVTLEGSWLPLSLV